jgi:hypothetical protein
MLVIAIAALVVAWAVVAVVVVGLCVRAAAGDRALAEAVARPTRSRGAARGGPYAAGA